MLIGRLGRLFKVLLLVSLGIPSIAASENYRGLSAFASTSSRYPCDRFLDIVEHSKAPAMAIVLGTRWGKTDDDYSLDCPIRFLNRFTDRPHLLEIHISNEAGRRKAGALGTGDFAPHLSVKELNKRLEAGNPELIAEYQSRIDVVVSELAPHATIFSNLMLSLGLEDNYSLGAYRTLKQAAEEKWEGSIVRNPCTGSKTVDTELLHETHALNKTFKTELCIANEDGNFGQGMGSSMAFLRRYKACYATFLWRGRHQGRTSPVWTPRAKRTIQIPNSDVINISKLMAY